MDRNPFTEGLRLARQQADSFERNKVTAEVDADTAKADAEIAGTQAELDKLDHTRATPTVSVNTRESRQGIGLLGTAIIALGPAAIAAGGVAAGALAPVALGLAGVAAVAIPLIKELSKGKGSPAALASFQALTAAWHGFQAAVDPAVVGLITTTFALLGTTLPAMAPLVVATAQAFTLLVQGLIPLAPVFGAAFAQMSPLINLLTQGLLHITQQLAHWTQGDGFTHFIAYVAQVGPQMGRTLLAVANALIRIGVAAAPMLPPLLTIVTTFANLVSWLTRVPGLLAVVVSGFVAYKTAALAAAAATQIGLLGLFGPSMQARLAAEATVAGTASGQALGLSFATRASLVAAAAFAGWQIGSWLRAHVPVVAAAGDFIGRQFAEAFLGATTPIQQAVDQAIASVRTMNLSSVVKQVAGIGSSALGAAAVGGGAPAAVTPAVISPAATALGVGPKQATKEKPYEGFNPVTHKIEFHTSTQWTHIHAVEEKRAYDQSQRQMRAGKAPSVQTPTEGFNPLTGRVEFHTASEWRHIHAINAQRSRQRSGARSGAPHIRSGTFQDTTASGLAGPRSIVHDFADGGAITGQTVKFRHSPDYGRPKTAAEKAQERSEEHLRKIRDLLEGDAKGPRAHITVTTNSKPATIDTESRRRGRAPGRR